MIITYRKLSVTLTKNIQPLLKCVKDERLVYLTHYFYLITRDGKIKCFSVSKYIFGVYFYPQSNYK